MKKRLLTLLILLFVAVGCGANDKEESKENTTQIKESYGYDSLENLKHNIVKLSYEDLKAKVDKKESFFIMIGRPSCPPCVMSIPSYSSISQEEGVKEVYYFDYELIYENQDDKGKIKDPKLQKQMDYLTQTFNFDGSTPSYYKVKDGVKVATTNDLVDDEKYKTWDDILKYFIKENK
ncbi:MAG: hypothetical protein RR543_04470 [Erysipelotrichales bacterium]